MFFFFRSDRTLRRSMQSSWSSGVTSGRASFKKVIFQNITQKGHFSSSKTSSKKVGKHLSPLKRWKRGKHKLSEAFSFAKHCCLERRMHTYPSPQIHTSSGDNVWFWERPLNPCFVLVPGFTVVLVLSSEHTIRKNKTQNCEWKDLARERERTVFENVRVISQRARHRLPREWRRALAPFSSLAGADQPGKHTKQSDAKFSELPSSCWIYLWKFIPSIFFAVEEIVCCLVNF